MISCHNEDEFAYIRGILHSSEIKGAVVEIGIYHGAVSKLLREELPESEIHLFDTFGGMMSEYAEPNWPTGDYSCSLKEVKKNIGESFIFHEGDICKTKEDVEDKQFAFIHIDLDVYIPLASCLPFFLKRLKQGGIMLISNYDNSHPGVKKAVDEIIKPQKRYSRYVFIKKA